MENFAIRCAEWLECQVKSAEQTDHLLRPLKDKINDLAEKIKNSPDNEIEELLHRQDQAIINLIKHIATLSDK